MSTEKHIDEKSSTHSQEPASSSTVHSSDADVGYDLYLKGGRQEKEGGAAGEEDFERISRRVARKIDRRVLPIM